MPAKTQEGMCVVSGCGDLKKFKGLCKNHYARHTRGRDDHTQAIAAWEVSQSHSGVCGYWTYKTKLKSILRGVDGLTRDQRGDFARAMLDAYAKANPVEFARAQGK